LDLGLFRKSNRPLPEGDKIDKIDDLGLFEKSHAANTTPARGRWGLEKANETAVRERSELVDVDVARAAGTAPVGGGAHSFGVGDRDRDAACWGWGRGALL
jgi:hypothetical protein